MLVSDYTHLFGDKKDCDMGFIITTINVLRIIFLSLYTDKSKETSDYTHVCNRWKRIMHLSCLPK